MQAKPANTAVVWGEKLRKVADHRDRQAFNALFKHYAPQIKSYGLTTNGISGVQAFADELVQECMIKIWHNAAHFNPSKANANTWVFTIVRNTRIDLLRRGARHRADLDADDVWLAADPGHGEPVIALEQQQAIDAIRQNLGKLPVPQNQVLAKVYLEGKTHSEVAAELELPLGTIKSRIRLALGKLKLLLDA